MEIDVRAERYRRQITCLETPYSRSKEATMMFEEPVDNGWIKGVMITMAIRRETYLGGLG